MVQPWFNPSFLPFPNLPRSSVKKKDHELSERAAAVLREQLPEVQEMVLQGRGKPMNHADSLLIRIDGGFNF